MAAFYKETQYGFQWGPVEVQRQISHKGYVVFGLKFVNGMERQLYVSPTGRSVRLTKPFRPRNNYTRTVP